MVAALDGEFPSQLPIKDGKITLHWSTRGRLDPYLKVELVWGFALFPANTAHVVSLTASFKTGKRVLLHDGEQVHAVLREAAQRTYAWQRDGHSFAIQELLEGPRDVSRFRFVIDSAFSFQTKKAGAAFTTVELSVEVPPRADAYEVPPKPRLWTPREEEDLHALVRSQWVKGAAEGGINAPWPVDWAAVAGHLGTGRPAADVERRWTSMQASKRAREADGAPRDSQAEWLEAQVLASQPPARVEPILARQSQAEKDALARAASPPATAPASPLWPDAQAAMADFAEASSIVDSSSRGQHLDPRALACVQWASQVDELKKHIGTRGLETLSAGREPMPGFADTWARLRTRRAEILENMSRSEKSPSAAAMFAARRQALEEAAGPGELAYALRTLGTNIAAARREQMQYVARKFSDAVGDAALERAYITLREARQDKTQKAHVILLETCSAGAACAAAIVDLLDLEDEERQCASLRALAAFRAANEAETRARVAREKLEKLEEVTHEAEARARELRAELEEVKASSPTATSPAKPPTGQTDDDLLIAAALALATPRADEAVASSAPTLAGAAPAEASDSDSDSEWDENDAACETLLAAERAAAEKRTQSRAEEAARHKEAITRRLTKRRSERPRDHAVAGSMTADSESDTESENGASVGTAYPVRARPPAPSRPASRPGTWGPDRLIMEIEGYIRKLFDTGIKAAFRKRLANARGNINALADLNEDVQKAAGAVEADTISRLTTSAASDPNEAVQEADAISWLTTSAASAEVEAQAAAEAKEDADQALAALGGEFGFALKYAAAGWERPTSFASPSSSPTAVTQRHLRTSVLAGAGIEAVNQRSDSRGGSRKPAILI